MLNKILGGGLVLLFLAGCESVRDIGVVPVGPAVARSPTEAQKLSSNGRVLFATQPRTLSRATAAAQQLAEAAAILTNDYAVQWAAAEAWEFVADNEARHA